jgi:hypothetical protein
MSAASQQRRMRPTFRGKNSCSNLVRASQRKADFERYVNSRRTLGPLTQHRG